MAESSSGALSARRILENKKKDLLADLRAVELLLDKIPWDTLSPEDDSALRRYFTKRGWAKQPGE